jgi:hypothetical protein
LIDHVGNVRADFFHARSWQKIAVIKELMQRFDLNQTNASSSQTSL